VADDFLDSYLQYTAHGETPVFFHRWAAITALGALLGRNYCILHGHKLIYPNIYAMLMGTPGTRKSTAIDIVKGIIKEAGYKEIAADKTTKEKFMLDLSGEVADDEGDDFHSSKRGKYSVKSAEEFLDKSLWGTDQDEAASRPPAETFIMAGEFNDFLGNGNIEFISLLGNLWDYNGVYRYRIKSGKSIAINNPTISLLGGNTPTGFSLAFPTEIFGQGFFSRLLLIHGEPNGRKIAFPKAPAPEDTAQIVRQLQDIRRIATGVAGWGAGAREKMEKIYNLWQPLDDVRFASYSNRRFTHLLKLCLVVSAARFRKEVTAEDVVYANTILTFTEHLMPKALGEFGKSKYSDVTHKVASLLATTNKPLKLNDIWKHVSTDLERQSQLMDILQSLAAAEKIQSTKGGFLGVQKVMNMETSDILDYNLLSAEERK